MQSYIISSTSNLLEKNNCWEPLSEKINLEFAAYGDISSGFIQDLNKGIIVVLFVEDLVQNNTDDYALVKEAYQAFLELVRRRAKESKKPIILCLGSKIKKTVIASSRYETKYKQFCDQLENDLIQLRDKFNTIYFINLNDVFYSSGSQNVFSNRNWYFGRCRLSIEGLKILVNSIAELVERFTIPPKKVLVLDCDNTLWGGVIGEDGLEGLLLGQDGLGHAFIDFQNECLRLSKEGVLIVLASKNNIDDVWNVFENHSGMILQRQDIVAEQINWNEKPDNLEKIAGDLDLGIDSFVFWDDNPIERNKMKIFQPEVLTLDVPKSVIDWPDFIRGLNCFENFSVTVEDTSKSQQYKIKADFKKELKSEININSYLSTINMKPKIVKLNDDNISRAEQMCMKTNQFNLRTKRYTSKELQDQNIKSDMDIFMVSLSDKFGDHGNIALIGLNYFLKNIIFLDTFLMSCRVLGRNLEAWILNQIFLKASEKDIKYLMLDFIPNNKNRVAEQFLHSYGFCKLADGKHETSVENEIANYPSEGDLYLVYIQDMKIPNLEIF